MFARMSLVCNDKSLQLQAGKKLEFWRCTCQFKTENAGSINNAKEWLAFASMNTAAPVSNAIRGFLQNTSSSTSESHRDSIQPAMRSCIDLLGTGPEIWFMNKRGEISREVLVFYPHLIYLNPRSFLTFTTATRSRHGQSVDRQATSSARWYWHEPPGTASLRCCHTQRMQMKHSLSTGTKVFMSFMARFTM